MDSSTALPFTSEPVDIGDLFSSYTYESPTLNSLDDFKAEDSHRKEKGFLVTDLKLASASVLVSEKPVEHNYLTNEDIGSSCLLSLSSEPPDIKNWFSSYLYESPTLDSIIDFRASVHNGIGDMVENDAVNSTEEPEQSSDTVGENVHLGCIESANNDKSDGWLECGQKSDGVTDPVIKLENQIINSENISAKQFESQNETSEKNLKTFNIVESRILFETVTGNAGSKSTKKLMPFTVNLNAQHSPDDSTKISPTKRLDFSNQMKKRSAKGPIGDDEKENYENEFAENGFISTRKYKQNDSERSLRPSNFKLPRAADWTSLKGGATCRRKVLSETINTQRTTTVLGTTGKWKCPQKSRPNLGPPLKQLRLDKLFHRP
ncbi:hypothetical protein LIER_36625 [Lithospermum erythrorhizon]|uniref:Uncharacterized protein n=1 Tax=Lithospermum erythrorhizon TaxID=34254 RepID=A0AAV3P8I0_LITER